MATWWVNQGQTFEQEVRGGYMWSPKKQRDGQKLQSYDFMTDLSVGDVVFSYHRQAIRARGIVTKTARSVDKPQELEGLWNREGWLIEVDYFVTTTPFAPKSEWEQISKMMPEKYAPLDKNGDGNQKMYLTSISDELGAIMSLRIEPGRVQVPAEVELQDEVDFFDQMQIWDDPSLSETERAAIVMARRGQGKFRERVYAFEQSCRVTGVSDPRVLIASHIKPWSVSEGRERIDGNNGLMLSPHVDKLFDQGLMTFGAKGKIYFSPRLSPDVVERWNLKKKDSVGTFTEAQQRYLEHHREFVFESAGF